MSSITYLSLLLLLLGFVPSTGQNLALYGLDARRSQILQISPSTGEILNQFSSPVLCRPEGACGLAFSGHSLFFVDATDPDRLIYEFAPDGTAIWHSFPAPGAKVDGLAFADGALLALSFDEDRIYHVDTFAGEVVRQVDSSVDLVGGLAAGGGTLYASQIRPPVVYALDAGSGAVVREISVAGALPTGLAVLGQRLFVGDFTGQRILEFALPTGAEVGQFGGAAGRFSGLAAGSAQPFVPYVLQINPVAENLTADGRVELVVRAGIYDTNGRLLRTNNHTQILFGVAGSSPQVVQVTAGEAEAVLTLDPGAEVVVEARVLGLASAFLTRRIVAPATRIELHFTENFLGLIKVEAKLFDGTGGLAFEDTSSIYFSVLRGLAAVIGPQVVAAREGKAHTWIEPQGRDSDLVIAAQVRSFVHSAGFQVSSAFADSPVAEGGGLAVSVGRVGGRDQFPPAPPTDIEARNLQDQVEIRWTLSADDVAPVWFDYGDRRVRQLGVYGYRVYRSRDRTFYEEIGRVGPGVDRYFDRTRQVDGTYRYKVLAEDQDNWREMVILPGTTEDMRRTVMIDSAVGVDAGGAPIYGLFDEDLDVDLDDFFLFADHFGRELGEQIFDPLFDLDESGAVDFADFFLLADHFGQQAVSR
ncbi:MAG: hypothetical protein HOM86_02740 [Gemmatimonadetes bacterium]|nr:hypothetical protein [Gemmatimonadota bacterium]